MILLVLGILEWSFVHWLKRLAPGLRQSMTDRMGDASKGFIAFLLVMSIVLMVLGYRQAEFIPVWDPLPFLGHLNNLLMYLAIYLFAVGGGTGAKVWLGTKIRHPMLAGVKTWAFAHLLANGDLASIILFGGLLMWAAISVLLINRAEGPWTPPPRADTEKETIIIVVTLVLYAIIAGVHMVLGVTPFGGL